MNEGMVFCRACGGQLHSSAPFCPHCGAPQDGGGDGIERTFGNSVAICLRKYVVVQGRAPRAEYWWFVLFGMLAQFVASVAEMGLFGYHGNLAWLVSLALFLPSIAVWIRRLHDVGRAGWWILIALVPLVGWIFVLVWACSRSEPGENRFGPRNP